MGIGPLTAAWILVATLNVTLGESGESLAAYAWLVPMDDQSGTSVRRPARIGPGGHARLRRVVYLAAVSACRWNPPLKASYERLVAAGKPSNVARCAVARKLLHQAWAVATKQQPFDPSYHEQATHVTA
jgi:transposase